MNRKDFLKKSFIGLTVLTAAGGASACLNGCSSSTAPADIDFTLDLNDSANAALRSVGGSRNVNGVIVVCSSNGSYIAVQSNCTHEGATLSWQQTNKRFYCPEHGATFAQTGSVLGGPAKSNLVSYNVTVNGTLIRVTS
ncbi:MAG: Rieske 2Fe-2S domain-containing protein [Candidatus Kapabacteria bacterium]|nr:Rieske 2Fe-2S domain-containing protein [Candidatus Kapabacteria bacterium]